MLCGSRISPCSQTFYRRLSSECSGSIYEANRLGREARDAGDDLYARPQSEREHQVEMADAVIAVFADHNSAETAVKKLSAAGFEMKHLSVVGKGCHTEEKVVGFYTVGRSN